MPRERSSHAAFRRLWQRPGFVGAALVVATIGVAGALAYEAVRASASHRASVEATLEHHAATAAWHFARGARSWLGYGMEQAGAQLRNTVPPAAVLPGPDILTRVLAEKYCDCMTAGFARTFVRTAAPRGARIDVVGEPLSQRAADDLLAAMRALAVDTMPLPRDDEWRMLAPGTPRLNRATDVALLWVVRDAARRVRAVYGMIVEQAQIERPLIGALEDAEFFPPSLVKPEAADSLVRIEVRAPNGAVLFARGPDASVYTRSDSIGGAYGELAVYASINAAAAQHLVPGGVPTSRAPLIVVMLAVMLAMAGAAEVLRRREARLARLREDFVSGVSHELRTPLTQIRMLSELLATDGFKSADERARAVGIVHRESMRLTSLVENILDFTRLRRTAVARDQSLVVVGDVLRDVAADLEPLLSAVRNTVEVSAEADVRIRGDHLALGRIVRNLVENAAKYGRAPQTIRIALTNGDQRARITVDDEGPGIPADERERIWQPYYRLDRDRNAPAGGSGLGLAVVAELVTMLGGTAQVGDAPSGGARFMVEFPSLP